MKKFRQLIACLFFVFCSSIVYSQNITVTGNVSDSQNGEPLIDAYVLVKGTSNGTVTDVNGDYTINCPADAYLVFSYVGYAALEVPVQGKTILNVKMRSDNVLDELVVTAMGMTKAQKAV